MQFSLSSFSLIANTHGLGCLPTAEGETPRGRGSATKVSSAACSVPGTGEQLKKSLFHKWMWLGGGKPVERPAQTSLVCGPVIGNHLPR